MISVDVLPCENVDVVAEAEALPFRDRSFDHVGSGAVFEHLHDPLRAIAEVRRVLEPGGTLHVDTAFLQGYHGYPGHYFNMTPQAVETFLVDDFDLEQATVPDSATPVHTVLDLLERFLSDVPAPLRSELLERPLGELLERLRTDETRTSPLLAAFDEHALRALCASFVVVARKPDGYEERTAELEAAGEDALDEWRSSKRDYYAARTAVIHRHHEVALYRRLCEEAGRNRAGPPEPEALEVLLTRCRPASMLQPGAVRASIAALRDEEAELARLRDGWIRAHGASASRRRATVSLLGRVQRRLSRLGRPG